MGTKTFWKVAIFAVLIFCLLQATAWAVDPNPYYPKVGPRPGEKDPLPRTTLFQDDELLVLADYNSYDPGHLLEYYSSPTVDNIKNWSDGNGPYNDMQSQFGDSSKFRHMAAASGRLDDPKRDTAVYAAFRPDGKVQVELWDPQSGRHTSVKALDGTTHPERSVDVAVGDLDKVVDENGMYHDEIVVVRTYSPSHDPTLPRVAIDVLDKDLNIIGSDILVAFGGDFVAVAIGDFNGDGYLEVAAGMTNQTQPAVTYVRLYRFARNQDGSLVTPLQFQKVSDYSPPDESPYYDRLGFDMTAGDFDGDGKDEVYFVTAIATCESEGFSCGDRTDFIHTILRADKDLKLSRVYHQQDEAVLDHYIPVGQLRTQSGLFKFDPATGWTLNRRQVTTCYVNPYTEIGPFTKTGEYFVDCQFYSFAANSSGGFDRVSYTISSTYDIYDSLSYIDSSCGLGIDLAIGNYVGHGTNKNQTSPLMHPVVAFTGCSDPSYFDSEYHIFFGAMAFFKQEGDAAAQTFYQNYVVADERDAIVPVAATALDGDGDTWRLGPPMHFVAENVLSLDYIIQEPPKHVDCLPNDPSDPNKCEVINVSAQKDFNVELVDEKSQTLTSTSTDTTSWSIGGSAELDVKNTWSFGIPLIKKVEVAGEVDTKLSYDYESSRSQWNKDYKARTISSWMATEKDDGIGGKLQMFDIWRYPIIGFNTSDPIKPYGMYEVILPGPQLGFSAGGLDKADWYQPIHQNRNVLSYPRIGTPFPPDVGEYTLPDGTKKTETMNPLTVRSVSGTAQTLEVKWSEEAGSGKETTYNNTLSESVDIKFDVGTKGIFAGDVSYNGSVNFHNSNSWGGSTTSEATNSASKGITLNLPSGDSNYAYEFMPAFYISSGGGMIKVAHAVDPRVSGSSGWDWWSGQYAGKPDPALNLPTRFSGGEPEWTLNKDNNRMRMRGFFMRHNKQDPVSGQYEVIDPGSLTDGDMVQLCGRVYNFSLDTPTGPFDVLFEYAPTDSKGNETGPRVTVGAVSTNLESFESGQSMKEVCVPWNTTGLGGKQFRFYVTVDPNNVITNEIHEWKDSNGNKLIHGNNEGYWPWGSGIVIARQALPTLPAEKPGTSMHSESLAIEKDSGVKSKGPVRVFVGETYTLRAHIVADGHHRGTRYTVFFDGPPEEGKVIAIKASFGFIDGDNYVWANWTPRETGEREIYVHFIEDSDEEIKGDAWDSLKVVVRQEPISWRDEVIDRLMGVEE